MDSGAIDILKKYGCLYMKDDYKDLLNSLELYYKEPEWISVEDKEPEGYCLIKLDGKMLGLTIHSANYTNKNMVTVAGLFIWDLTSKVTHWKPLPKE
jgi:hypothetical protein